VVDFAVDFHDADEVLFCVFADSEGRAEEIDHHKDDMLKKQKEGKGHWKEELASSSESIVCLLPA